MRLLLSVIAVAVCSALVPPCVAQKPAPLDGIAAVKDENGRTVYVNAPRPGTASTSEAHPRRASVLVYWSNQERKWKPVPAPSPSAMRAARQAADEVASYVRSQPATSSRQAVASQNPNYRRLASGRVVSNSAIDAAIQSAAVRHNVDPNLVRAVIKVESNFNPNAVSKKGAMGLMQLMPATARELNVGNPFNPEENVDAGVRHLKHLLTSYKGDVRLSLAAYNAGQGAVARFNGVPRFTETQNYVRQITGLYTGGSPATSTPDVAPIRMFRSTGGVLTLSNEE